MEVILPNLEGILKESKKRPIRLWGWRPIHPITKKRTWHNGIDLTCVEGTPIFCPWDGVVTRNWVSKLSGNALRIRHTNVPGVRETAYAHLFAFPEYWESEIKAETIQVKAGDLIGYVGSTGRSTGPHLHFIIRGMEVRRLGGRRRSDVDPLTFLERSLAYSQ